MAEQQQLERQNAATIATRQGGGQVSGGASSKATTAGAVNNSTLKIVIIGDAGSGKTSLVRRFQYGVFQAGTRTTVGVEFAQKALVVDGNNVTIRMWDVAGQESTRNASRTYYQGAVGCFLVVDATNPQSMEASLKWKADLDEKTANSKFNLVNQTLHGNPYPNNANRLPCFLLLNKCDLGVSIGKTKMQLEQICQRFGIQGYFETSAATGDGCNDALESAVRSMMSVYNQSEASRLLGDSNHGGGNFGPDGRRSSGDGAKQGRFVLSDKNLEKDSGTCSKC